MNIAIIGKLKEKFQAPYNDKNWHIWGCNLHNDFDKIPRYDLWFDIHINPGRITELVPPEKLVLRKEYPIADVQLLMKGNWLNNSMCYMLAYALLKHLEGENVTVKFFGCSLNEGEEIRTRQKQALREMRMFCEGMGMTVSAQDETLFKDYPMYY